MAYFNRFALFVDHGRICMTDDTVQRTLRGFALGRKSWLFAGSDRGAGWAVAMATLINTAKLNDIDPQAWLVGVLDRFVGKSLNRFHELLPWEWKADRQTEKA